MRKLSNKYATIYFKWLDYYRKRLPESEKYMLDLHLKIANDSRIQSDI